jgi:hypothetical protein
MSYEFREMWRQMSNASLENDRNAVCFVERRHYVDELEAAFILGICDFKKGYKFCPRQLTYEEGLEWSKGWLAMKCMTKRKEFVPPPSEAPLTGPEYEAARNWRWERYRELALAQGVEVGNPGYGMDT